jgi:hypothetical protein
MLVLSTLHNLLEQVLDQPGLHTAILLTPEGQLVSFASQPRRLKDKVRRVVGLSGSIWQETKAQGIGMVESEVSLFVTLPTEVVFEAATVRPCPRTPSRRRARQGLACPLVEYQRAGCIGASNAIGIE